MALLGRSVTNVSVRLDELYKRVKKRPGKAKIIASVIVPMKNGPLVKIVFVRNRNGRGWLALLSTDTDLPDEEIIRIYGKRWDIEVFFKMSKHHLNLEREMQLRDYDGWSPILPLFSAVICFWPCNRDFMMIRGQSAACFMPVAMKFVI